MLVMVSAESDKLRMEKTAKLNRLPAEALVIDEAGVADKYETAGPYCGSRNVL